jgi:uncharacterized protein YndB with AHSA1/START domain
MICMEPTTVHSTFVVEHHYPYSPEKVFAAFSDPARKRRWYAEGEANDVEQYEMDFRVGGEERLRYHFRPGHPIEGQVITNQARIQDIVPGQRVVSAQTMTLQDLTGQDKRLFSALVTLEFVPSADGTDLICTNQGAFYEAAGPDFPKMIEQGWRSMLGKIEQVLGK